MSAAIDRVKPLPFRPAHVSDQPGPIRPEGYDVPAPGSGGVWSGLQLPWLAVIAGCASADALAGRALVNFREPEARTLRALAALLLPASGDTGARAAGLAVHFVDRALDMRFFADAWPELRAGLPDLDVRARALGAPGFAALDAARQVAVVRQLEGTPFLTMLRDLLVTGAGATTPDERARRHVA